MKSKRARDELSNVPHLIERYEEAILATTFSKYLKRLETFEYQPLKELVDSNRGIPYGIIQTGKHTPGGIPTVRAGDIKAFKIDKDRLKRVDPKISANYARTILTGGEVLLSIRGTVGNTAVIGEDLAGCNISREVAMIPVHDSLNPNYLAYFLASRKGQAFIRRNIRGVAQSGINLRDLRELPIPYCAIEHQNKVVSEIERAIAWIDKIDDDQRKASHLIDRLDQTILAKAFRGELVPHDPTDEPASVILQGISEDRARQRNEAARGTRRHGKRGEKPMERKKLERRPIIEVVNEHITPISPERLFQLAGFSPEQVDAFYAEIKQAVQAGQIEQDSEKNLGPAR